MSIQYPFMTDVERQVIAKRNKDRRTIKKPVKGLRKGHVYLVKVLDEEEEIAGSENK